MHGECEGGVMGISIKTLMSLSPEWRNQALAEIAETSRRGWDDQTPEERAASDSAFERHARRIAEFHENGARLTKHRFKL